MKKMFLISGTILISIQAHSQWLGSGPIYNNPLTSFVGIGTTTPASRLTIYDASNSVAGQQIRIGTSATTDYTFGRNPTSGYLNFSGSQTGLIGYTFMGGKMGVGTTSPVTTLTVQTGGSNDGVRVIQTGTTAAVMSLVGSGAGARNWGILSSGSSSPQTIGNFSIYDFTSGADRLFIQGTTGNVAIGTTTPPPVGKLNVHDGALRVTGMTAGFGGSTMLFGGSGVTATNGEWAITYTTATPGYEGMDFWRPFGATGGGGDYYMFMHNNGKIGINTNNPTAQLTVNGNVLIGNPATISIPNANYKLFVETGILTEKIKVALATTLDWSDYVFENNYELRSIDEVKTFIGSNKHLPGVPSAVELVEQGGFDLGKMDAKLLEKIEELTLYVIQLNEKNKLLEERLSKVESTK